MKLQFYTTTIKHKNFTVKKPGDLKGLRVNSFVGALKRYPEWLSEIGKTDLYSEKNDQSTQALLLNFERVDVVLSDINIYKYYASQSKSNPRFKNLPVVFHPFTTVNPSHYQLVFSDPKLRDDYNLGLKELIKKGRIKEIYKHYIK